MKVKRISFFDNFKCSAQNCPDTCCKGWIIPLDDKALELYHSQSGLLLLRLILTEQTQNDTVCFNKNSKTCPHLLKDGLCYLQKEYGEHFLCETCREYPRLLFNYRSFCKECLDISCPEAAKLFINNLGSIKYDILETDISYDVTITNDDEVFLTSLSHLEDKFLSHIDDDSLSLDIIFKDLSDYARLIQQEYISNPSTDILNKEYSFASNEALTFDALTTDRIIHTSFYHIKLRKTDPELYRLCKLYKRKFNKLLISDIDTILAVMDEEIKKVYPKIDILLRSYCKYFIMCTFMAIYEDYSFLKHTCLAFVHTHMLKLFIYLHIDEKHTLNETQLIQIINAYDRRAKHNNQIIAEMYDEIYKVIDPSSF